MDTNTSPSTSLTSVSKEEDAVKTLEAAFPSTNLYCTEELQTFPCKENDYTAVVKTTIKIGMHEISTIGTYCPNENVKESSDIINHAMLAASENISTLLTETIGVMDIVKPK